VLAIALLRGGDSIMLRSAIPFMLAALFVGELIHCTLLLTQTEWTVTLWANAQPLVQPAVLLIAAWSLWRDGRGAPSASRRA
jgi:hypothetical protein